MLTRRFVGLNINDSVWIRVTSNQNRKCQLNESVLRDFIGRAIVLVAERKRLSLGEYFGFVSTLFDVWWYHKGFKLKDDNKLAYGVRGESRFNKTYASTNDGPVRVCAKIHLRRCQAAIDDANADGKPQRYVRGC